MISSVMAIIFQSESFRVRFAAGNSGDYRSLLCNILDRKCTVCHKALEDTFQWLSILGCSLTRGDQNHHLTAHDTLRNSRDNL